MPFRDIYGHRRVVELLARSIERDSMPPSLIFAGPSGVGKRLAAGAVAQALNCLSPRRDGEWLDACGACAACSRIARGIHPDAPIVEPGDSGSIKIDQVRDIVDRSAYRPFEGRRRAVIIDDADALVPAAQNALLKTLEEPPPASVFMLVTARPDMLLPTVRSRCPQLRFRPLSPDDVARALMAAGRTAAEARAVAATAEGSVGRALEASADDVVEARAAALRVLADIGRPGGPGGPGGVDARRRLEATKYVLPDKSLGPARDREYLTTHLRAMASLLRDVELLSASADPDGLANADVRHEVERLSGFRGERGVRAFEAVDRALVALERNAGAKIVADWVILQL